MVAATTTTKKTYKDMIADAITTLKERNGSSRQAIKKYIQANNDITANFDSLFNNALKKGVSSGNFAQPKGPSGPVKLVKISIESRKPAAAKPSKKVVSTKKAAPKKAIVSAKKSSPKKPLATTTTKKNLKAKSKIAAPKKAVVSSKKSAKITKNSKTKKVVPKKTITKKTVKKTK